MYENEHGGQITFRDRVTAQLNLVRHICTLQIKKGQGTPGCEEMLRVRVGVCVLTSVTQSRPTVSKLPVWHKK